MVDTRFDGTFMMLWYITNGLFLNVQDKWGCKDGSIHGCMQSILNNQSVRILLVAFRATGCFSFFFS